MVLQVLNHPSPVLEGVFEDWREGDVFRGARHRHIHWREEAFASGDSETGVLQFPRQLLKRVEWRGTLP